MAGSTLASLSTDNKALVAKSSAQSPGREAWRRFKRHKLAVVCTIVLSFIVLAVLLGPFVWRVPINEIDFMSRMQGPSWAHPLGTDDLGQDILARVLYGGRISLAVGLAAMLIAISVGVVVGAVAGMSKGPVDVFLMWITDLFLSLPQLPLLLLIFYLFNDTLKKMVGPEAGVFVLVVAVIGGLRWVPALGDKSQCTSCPMPWAPSLWRLPSMWLRPSLQSQPCHF